MSMKKVFASLAAGVAILFVIVSYRMEWDQDLIDWFRGLSASSGLETSRPEPVLPSGRATSESRDARKQLDEFERHYWMPVDPLVSSSIEEALALIAFELPQAEKPVISSEESRNSMSARVTFSIAHKDRTWRLDWVEDHRPKADSANISRAISLVSEYADRLGVEGKSSGALQIPTGADERQLLDQVVYRPASGDVSAWMRNASALAMLGMHFRAFDDSDIELWFAQRAFTYWIGGLAMGAEDNPMVRAMVMIAVDRPALALSALERAAPSEKADRLRAYARQDQATVETFRQDAALMPMVFDVLERGGESARAELLLDRAVAENPELILAGWRNLEEDGIWSLLNNMPGEIHGLTDRFAKRFKSQGFISEFNAGPPPPRGDLSGALAGAQRLTRKIRGTEEAALRSKFWGEIYERFLFAAARKYHLGSEWLSSEQQSREFAQAMQATFPESDIATVSMLRYLNRHGERSELDEFLKGFNAHISGPWSVREIARVRGSEVDVQYWHDAFTSYRAYVERETHGARGLRRLAYFAHHNFQPVIARVAARRAWRSDPHDWRVYRDLANYTSDVEWYSRALERPYKLILAEASHRAQEGERDAALALIDEAMEIQPSNTEAYRAKASLLAAAGRHEEAISALEKQLELAEKGLPTGFSKSLLAYQMIKSGRLQEAHSMFEEASRSGQLISLMGLATAKRLMGDTENAMDILRRATERYPGTPASGHLTVLVAQAANSERLEFGPNWDLARGMIDACDYEASTADCLASSLLALEETNRTNAARMIARELESRDRESVAVEFSRLVLEHGVDSQHFIGRIQCLADLDDGNRIGLYQSMGQREHAYFFNIMIHRGCFSQIRRLFDAAGPRELAMPPHVRALYAALSARMTDGALSVDPGVPFKSEYDRAVFEFLLERISERELRAYIRDTLTAKGVEYYAGIHDWAEGRADEARQHFLFTSTRALHGDFEVFWAFGHLKELGERPVGWCCNEAIY